ncbi:MAG: hypothetical protein IH586_06350 [Anaerolineaceae bacterium]|nr:hypothetical protein [Anaerolineaceae bacterium]
MKARPIMHVDFPTTDWRATGEFFSRLFGWEYQHEDTPLGLAGPKK